MNHKSKQIISEKSLSNRIAQESEIRHQTEKVLRKLDPSKKALTRELNIQINTSRKVNQYFKLHANQWNHDVGDCDKPQRTDPKQFIYQEVYQIEDSNIKLKLKLRDQSWLSDPLELHENLRRNEQKLIYLKELSAENKFNFIDKISSLLSSPTSLKKEVFLRIIGCDCISRSFSLNSIMAGLPPIINKLLVNTKLLESGENINARVRCDLLIDGQLIFSTETRQPSKQCWNINFNYTHDFGKALEFHVIWIAPYQHLTNVIDQQAARYRSQNFILGAIGYLPLNENSDHGFITRTVELYPGGRIYLDTFIKPSPQNTRLSRSEHNDTTDKDSSYSNRLTVTSPSPLPGFKLCALLGTGHFGKIILCQQISDRKYYAVKIIKKLQVVESDEYEQIISEKKVLEIVMEHPLLVHLFACLQDMGHLMFVLEFIQAGDLSTLIFHNGKFSDEQAQFYAASVVLCFEFLHHNNIMYRDLKMENLMLDSRGYIKLVDFGLCKLNMEKNSYTQTFCGTVDYMAPEIFSKRYTRMVDWWALGVLLHYMLTGEVPFSATSDEELCQAILYKPISTPSMNAITSSFIISLLNKNPNSRLGFRNGAKEVKIHPYFANVNFNHIFKRKQEAPYIPDLKHQLDLSFFDRQFTTQKPTLSLIEVDLTDNPDIKSFFDDFVKF